MKRKQKEIDFLVKLSDTLGIQSLYHKARKEQRTIEMNYRIILILSFIYWMNGTLIFYANLLHTPFILITLQMHIENRWNFYVVQNWICKLFNGCSTRMTTHRSIMKPHCSTLHPYHRGGFVFCYSLASKPKSALYCYRLLLLLLRSNLQHTINELKLHITCMYRSPFMWQ